MRSIDTEKELERLMFLLNFSINFEDTIMITYKNVIKDIVYNIYLYKYDYEIEIETFTKTHIISVELYTYDDAIVEIKSMFCRELREHKISKLLDDGE